MKAKILGLLVMLMALLVLSKTAAAGISFTGLSASQSYEQTATGTTYLGSGIGLDINVAAPTDFTGASVLVPGQSAPQVFTWDPKLIFNGTYSVNNISAGFPSSSPATSLGAMNAAYPLGIYTFTATNSVTSAQQTATLNYDANYFPTVTGGSSQTVVPALTTASYFGLQGMDAGAQRTVSFNAFTGSPVVCCGEVNPATYVSIFQQSNGATVYNSGPLSNSTTSLTLAAKTLQANTAYGYDVYDLVARHCGGGQSCGTGNPTGYYLNYSVDTYGLFTTAATNTPPPVTVNLQGGSLANPVALESTGRIGQVNGAIGGNTATDFYQFYWAGGTFASNVAITGANPLGQYEFELLNYFGGAVIQDITLTQGDNFESDMVQSLAAGTYEIGLVADSTQDPNFVLNFDTPVAGVGTAAVPEPASLGLLGVGLIGVLAGRRRKAA